MLYILNEEPKDQLFYVSSVCMLYILNEEPKDQLFYVSSVCILYILNEEPKDQLFYVSSNFRRLYSFDQMWLLDGVNNVTEPNVMSTISLPGLEHGELLPG